MQEPKAAFVAAPAIVLTLVVQEMSFSLEDQVNLLIDDLLFFRVFRFTQRLDNVIVVETHRRCLLITAQPAHRLVERLHGREKSSTFILVAGEIGD